MSDTKNFSRTVNQLFIEFGKMSAEVQVLACLTWWLLIAALLRLIYIGGGLPSAYEWWIAFSVLMVGVLSGPIVASVTAFACAILLSQFGLFPGSAETPGDWLARSAALFALALVGGTLQRLIKWINLELHSAQHLVGGTELPNIKATLAHLEKVMGNGGQLDEDLDVLNVRLSNLDTIRQTAGQGRLDQVLKKFADNLKRTLGEGAYVSQLSGNELLGIRGSQGRATQEIQKLVAETLQQPIHIDGEDYNLTASTGLHRTRAKRTSLTPQQLLDKAVALAIAAEKNNTDFQTSRDDALPDLGELASSRQIQAAMENGELCLSYIPRLSAKTGFFSSLEGVITWNHPKRGKLMLEDFRSMLEEESAVQGVCCWIVKLGFKDADEWLERGYKFRLSLGLSINNVLSETVLASLVNELQQRDASPDWLAIEITEKAMMKADRQCLQSLKHIQRRGITVVVSDYGDTGSTIQDVLKMPVDAVKLSSNAVEKAMAHSDQRRQLSILVKMVQSRGLFTVAEGVKSGSILRLLRSIGCEELQGPMLGMLLPKEKIPWARIRP